MTYKEIYEKAANMLDRGEITLGDFDKMVEPLNSEVHPEPHWIPVTKEEMFKAGYDGREIIFKVDGRLFAIRELAQ